jgi:PAS domain S-box-containing protein
VEKNSEHTTNYLNDLHLAIHKTALVAAFESDGMISEANEKLLNLLGFTRDEILGQSYSVLLSDQLSDVLRNEIVTNSVKGSPWKGQLCHSTKINTPLWVEASIQPIYDSNGLVSRYIYIGFDITEQKAVEEALEKNKNFLQKLMGSAPVGFFLADASGQCQLINEKWSKMSGLRLRQAVGFGWLAAVHPEDRDKVALAWSELTMNGTPFHMEYRYCDHAGEQTPVLASAVLLKEEPIAESRILRIEQDLTEQKRNEEIINAQRAQMISTSKLSTLGEMAGGIAHEINNPLAIILGSAELLKAQLELPVPDPARLNRLTTTIMNTTIRIAKIIKSLRSIARDGENDPFEAKELKVIFSETLEMCSARAHSRQVELKIPFIPSSFVLECRPTQISQALLNLINNSLFAIDSLQDKWVQIEVHDRSETIEIWVTDSGNGIPERDQEKIFNPFFTTKPVGKGTGLGLSVAKGFIENHGGSLQLDEKCVNTRFRVILPKQRSQSFIKSVS